MRTAWILSGLLVLRWSSAALATTVVTTPVLSGVADGGFTCHVLNASGARQQVRIELGPTAEPTETPLLPGDTTGVSLSSAQGELRYCRVTGSGRRGSLRVSLEVRSAGFPRGAPIAVVQGQE